MTPEPKYIMTPEGLETTYMYIASDLFCSGFEVKSRLSPHNGNRSIYIFEGDSSIEQFAQDSDRGRLKFSSKTVMNAIKNLKDLPYEDPR